MASDEAGSGAVGYFRLLQMAEETIGSIWEEKGKAVVWWVEARGNL